MERQQVVSGHCGCGEKLSFRGSGDILYSRHQCKCWACLSLYNDGNIVTRWYARWNFLFLSRDFPRFIHLFLSSAWQSLCWFRFIFRGLVFSFVISFPFVWQLFQTYSFTLQSLTQHKYNSSSMHNAENIACTTILIVVWNFHYILSIYGYITKKKQKEKRN